jgi:Na+-translocating ferredoxin:NAD+ oxidoreductase RnfC subunit
MVVCVLCGVCVFFCTFRLPAASSDQQRTTETRITTSKRVGDGEERKSEYTVKERHKNRETRRETESSRRDDETSPPLFF